MIGAISQRHRIEDALVPRGSRIKGRGYAIDDEETAEGMQCFGAPVYGPRRPEAVAAVAVSVIKAGLSTRRRSELVASVRQLAQELSNALGAAPRRATPFAQAA